MDTISLSNQVFVLMGVSGSGKSAVANEVAYQLRAAFLDGDFLHPRSNIKKMAAGYPLTVACLTAVGLVMPVIEPLHCSGDAAGRAVHLYCRRFHYFQPRQ